MQLGDKIETEYGQDEINNINKLIKILKLKRQSERKQKAKDSCGNVIYIDCDIFSINDLVTALDSSLKRFQGLIPEIEESTFLNGDFCMFFTYPLVLGAMLELLPGKALIEKGTEFTVQDNGISHNLLSLSDLVLKLIEIESYNYREEIKLIRANLAYYKNLFKI